MIKSKRNSLKKKVKKKIKQYGKKILLKLYHLMVKVLPVSKDVILFESNLGKNYTGNPKAIYEKMVELGLDKKYKIVWVFAKPGQSIKGEAKQVKRQRLTYFYYCAIAKIWVFDCRHPRFLIKRPENFYVQTWHGTPLKKLALDMEVVDMGGVTDIEYYRNEFRKNSSVWDCLISQNHFSSETFRRCFDFQKTMLEIGYPRNDVLMNYNNKEYIDQLKRAYDIPLDKKVILYAPTWRDNEYHAGKKYKFASALDFKRAKEALEDEYIMIVKFHYLIADQVDWTGLEGFIYSFPAQQEISDLYLISDIMITDYSSVMFDYSLLKRPMFFFAYDMDNYRENLRGFYFDMLEEVPGPVSMTTEQLIKDIKEYKKEEWEEKYKQYSEKFNHIDDGNASLHVIKEIEKHLK